MRKLTEEQIARIYDLKRRWEQCMPPCQVPHWYHYNPCLPEESRWEDKGWLFCCTCGANQRPELT